MIIENRLPYNMYWNIDSIADDNCYTMDDYGNAVVFPTIPYFPL